MAISEMQIKTKCKMIRFYYISLLEQLKLKIFTISNAGENVEKLDLSSTAGKIQNVQPLRKVVWHALTSGPKELHSETFLPEK